MELDRSWVALCVALLGSVAGARPCAHVVGGGDDCTIADAIVGPGLFAFDTTSATTGFQGQAEALCLYANTTSIENDVWFNWTSPFTGTAAVSLCGLTGLDTKVAVYAGPGCPSAAAIGCNDDACGSQSVTIFEAVAGSDYMIQIGVHPGSASGTGLFSITSAPPCPPAGSISILTYCMTGPGAGTPWSWKFSAPDGAFETFEDFNVPGVTGTTLAVAQAFAASFNAAAAARNCSGLLATASNGTNAICTGGALLEIQYTHVLSALDPELRVGAANTTPACFVQTTLPACTFNPTIQRLALPGIDCNQNGIDDVIDVESGTSNDVNGNQIPDECEGVGGTIFCTGDGVAPHTHCPCSNSSAVADQSGCLNSLGTGGRLRAAGIPSITQDSVVLYVTQVTNSACLFFQGTLRQNAGNGSVFGDGLRCAAGSIVRLKTITASAGAGQFPVAGDPSVSVRGQVTAPGTRTYQAWYRNAASFCTSSTFNLSNGLELAWTN